MAKQNGNGEKVKSMESWIWDAACSIRGASASGISFRCGSLAGTFWLK